MKQICAIALFATIPFATLAQEPAPEPPGLMERGARMFMEGLMQEMEPALEDLQGLAQDFGPVMQHLSGEMRGAVVELLQKVEDWSAYHPPQILPNGDIIMRRKQPPTETAPAENPAGETEI